jgi:hypothetical protein
MKKVLTLVEFDPIIEGQTIINEEYDQEFVNAVLYEKFDILDETDKEINETFNSYIIEGAISNFIALSTNPITGIKLANNAKKLARAQIQNATAKIDFEKKKQAADNVKEKDPFRNTLLNESDFEDDNAMLYSLKKAIDTVNEINKNLLDSLV